MPKVVLHPAERELRVFGLVLELLLLSFYFLASVRELEVLDVPDWNRLEVETGGQALRDYDQVGCYNTIRSPSAFALKKSRLVMARRSSQ